MPFVYFETFGCQMNVADSDMLGELLSGRGFSPCETPAQADLLVVNTCSVREHAEKRALARVAEFAGLKARSKPEQKIWVVGCMAQRLGNALTTMIRGVDRVIGAERIEYISHDLDAMLEQDFGPAAGAVARRDSGVSVFLPVIRGCDNYCAYCVVPLVRGREHSVAVDQLLAASQRMVDGGAREITLLGQNVNSYRDGQCDFGGLLEKIHSVENLKRLRFTTSHPKDLSLRLISAVADLPKVCKHIHLPVQSGSTAVLDRMSRRYSRENYLGLVDRIRRAIPGADITSDVMVGFPGETDHDFKQTMSLVEQVRFTTAFMFAFSPREGTAASALPGQVAAEVKQARLEELIHMQTAITKKHYQSMVGSRAHVLFTQRQAAGERAWMGQDNGCKRVLLRCDQPLAGTILPVKIASSSGMTLVAQKE